MKAKYLKALLDALNPESDVLFVLNPYVHDSAREQFARALLGGGWEDVNVFEDGRIEIYDIGEEENEYMQILLSPCSDTSDMRLLEKEFYKRYTKKE